jgi:Clp amino terminal domain, pathogenicity island component/Putative restriction endonuclease
MFERYTEKARRVIFFARYEASEFGSSSIETEHLLLGLLREDKALTNRFLPAIDSVESIRQRVRAVTPARPKISTSVDLPLSQESQRVLAYAAEETERLSHKHLGTEHLLLGLLREENCLAATLLREHGLAIETVREEVAARKAPSSDSPGQVVQSNLLRYLKSIPTELDILETEWGIYVRPNRSPATQPFLYIEILSPADRLRDLRRRMDEQFAKGVRYIWMVDPGTRHVYSATSTAGLQEFKGDVLRTENPVLELPLAEIFA